MTRKKNSKLPFPSSAPVEANTDTTATAAPVVNVKSEKPAKVKPPKCPISRAEFLKVATFLPVTLGESHVAAIAKEFSTGSFGFGFTDKITVKVGDKHVRFQVSLNCTAIGSKEVVE